MRPETDSRKGRGRRPNSRYVDIIGGKVGGVLYAIKPAGLEVIRKLAAGGYSNSTIGAKLGLNPSTFTEMVRRDPDVAAACEVGGAILEDELVHELLTAVRKGNPIPAMFLLKTRRGYREQGPSDGSAAPTVNIQINAPLSHEDFLKVVGPLPPEIEG